jgi:hypothetical protein
MSPSFRDVVNAFWRWRAGTHLRRATNCLCRGRAHTTALPLARVLEELETLCRRDRRRFGLPTTRA